MKKIINSLLLVTAVALFSCGQTNENNTVENKEKKIGVLLVNHGSVAESWRNMLLDVETQVREEVLKFLRLQLLLWNTLNHQ